MRWAHLVNESMNQTNGKRKLSFVIRYSYNTWRDRSKRNEKQKNKTFTRLHWFIHLSSASHFDQHWEDINGSNTHTHTSNETPPLHLLSFPFESINCIQWLFALQLMLLLFYFRANIDELEWTSKALMMVHVNESCNQSISLFTHNLIKSGSLEHHVGINHGWSIYIKNIWSNECQVKVKLRIESN